MTISTTTSRASYNGNGVTTLFSVPFRFFQNSDLVVQLVTNSTGSSTTLVLTTHYTVSGADSEAGGSLMMLVPPVVGQTLVIRRVIAATQEVDYVAGDPFPAETHERALDRLTMLSQQGEEVNSRSLTLPAGDTTSGEIPQLLIRANKLLAFDSSGRPTVVNPSTDSATDVRMDLASTGSGKGAEMVAFKQAGTGAIDRTQQKKNEESVSPEDYGAGGADDTQSLKKFFDAVASGRPGKMQPREYRYNRATGGVLSADCARFVLDAQGATILCTAYPSAGSSAIIDFVNIRADHLELRGLVVDGGWQEVGAGVPGYCEAGGFFNYMHGLVLSADGGFVDAVGAQNVEGLGITTEGGQGLRNVQIGKIEAHNCWMIGIDLRSLAADVEDVQVGSINARNNGTRGVGWVQVNIGDNKAAAGSRRIQIGSISANDGGGTGVGVGQYANPANGDTSGAADISIGSIIAKGNAGHGVELYASINGHVGHIKAIENGKKGVYFERSDTNNLFGYVAGVDSITATLNGEDGVLLSGGSNYQVGAITAWNNGTSGAGFSGCKLYAANLPAQEMGHVQIGALRCFDDRASGSKTQDYGLSIAYFGQPFDFTSIDTADLSDNKAKDLAWLAFGNSKTVAFGELSYGSIAPDHADVSRILMTERGLYVQRWRTTDAAAVAPLVVKPTKGEDCIAVFTATGRDAAGTVTHYARCVDAYKWTGSGHTKQANLQTLESKTGATQAYSNDFGTAVGGYVQGLASTTLDWTVTLEFSTGVDRAFAI